MSNLEVKETLHVDFRSKNKPYMSTLEVKETMLVDYKGKAIHVCPDRGRGNQT